MSSSAHIDNKKKDILILVKGPTQGLEHTLTLEKIYSINFKVTKKIFVSVCIITVETVTCLSIVPNFTSLRQKILKL